MTVVSAFFINILMSAFVMVTCLIVYTAASLFALKQATYKLLLFLVKRMGFFCNLKRAGW